MDGPYRGPRRRTFRVGALPLDLAVSAYYNVVRPEIGPRWQSRRRWRWSSSSVGVAIGAGGSGGDENRSRSKVGEFSLGETRLDLLTC